MHPVPVRTAPNPRAFPPRQSHCSVAVLILHSPSSILASLHRRHCLTASHSVTPSTTRPYETNPLSRAKIPATFRQRGFPHLAVKNKPTIKPISEPLKFTKSPAPAQKPVFCVCSLRRNKPIFLFASASRLCAFVLSANRKSALFNSRNAGTRSTAADES